MTAFKRFLSKERDKANALKRGSHRTISMDFESVERSLRSVEPGPTPEDEYARDWAITLLERVMKLLRNEMEGVGKREQFDVLKDFISSTSEKRKCSDVAALLGLSDAAARMAASRLRQRYQCLLKSEIGRTVASPDEIDDEIRFLFTACRRK